MLIASERPELEKILECALQAEDSELEGFVPLVSKDDALFGLSIMYSLMESASGGKA